MEPDFFALISDTLQNFEEIKNNRNDICIHHENTKKMLKVLKNFRGAHIVLDLETGKKNLIWLS